MTYSITTFVALYLLGSDSEMYWNHAIKDCNLQRDFAKYSLRTIVNTQMFKTIGSDIITKDELLYLLHESFSKFNSEYHGLRNSDDGTLDLSDEEINIMLDNIFKCAKVDSNKDYITYSQFMDIIFTNSVKIFKSVKNKVNKKFCCCCCFQNFSNYNKNITDIKNDDENILNRFVEEGRKISNEKPKRKPHYPASMNEEYGFRSRNVSMNVKFESQRSRIQSENIKYSIDQTPTPTPTDLQNQPLPTTNDCTDTQNPTVTPTPIPPELATIPVIIETRKRRNQSVNVDDLIVRSPSSSIYLPAGAGGPTGSFRSTRAITMQSPMTQLSYRKSYRKNDNSFQKICTTPNSPENTARRKQKANSRKVNFGVENIVLPPLPVSAMTTLSSQSASSLLSSQGESPSHTKESSSQDDLLKNDEEIRKHSNNSHTHHHHHHHHHSNDDENQIS